MTFRIFSQEKELKKAYDAATQSMSRISTLAANNGLTKDDIRSGVLTVAPVYEGDRTRRARSYYVRGEMVLRVHDFARIGPDQFVQRKVKKLDDPQRGEEFPLKHFGAATIIGQRGDSADDRQPAHVRIRLLADGRAVVQTAAHDIGPGTYTSLTQIAAEELGVSRQGLTKLMSRLGLS